MKTPVRYFVMSYLVPEIEEVEIEKETYQKLVRKYLVQYGEMPRIWTERHTVRENGVNQLCLTVEDELGFAEFMESPLFNEWIQADDLPVDSDDWGPYDGDESYDMWKESQ